MKTLVTGANGQLGHDVCKFLCKEKVEHRGVDRTSFDLRDEDGMKRLLYNYRPEQIVHCAAYTNVDQAESDVDECMLVNYTATKTIATVCQQLQSTMIYISTDYVFDGTKQTPYAITDPTNPLNVYGVSKLMGENAVRESTDKHYVLRTSWLYGKNGRNFVKTILRLASERSEISVVRDEVGAPTFTEDLAKVIVELSPRIPYGTYHVANAGYCSRAEFAQEILRDMNIYNCKIVPVNSDCYPMTANRPKSSCLDLSNLRKVGLTPPPDWRDAVKRYLLELENNGDKV